jgi:hypothetical protein
VFRHPSDNLVEQVRVTVVKADPPSYDSLVDLGGWQDIAAGDSYTFTHDLYWDPTMMLVRAECSSTMAGISHLLAGSEHHWALGWQGAHVQNSTTTTVSAVRQPNDPVCPQMRVRIWKRLLRIRLPLVVRHL